MGITTGQQLRAIAEGVDRAEERARNVEQLVMDVAAEHEPSCACKICAWASKYPSWLERLRRERETR